MSNDFWKDYEPEPTRPAPAPGYCKQCKQYSIEEPLPAAQPTTEESSAVKPAAPVQEPDHGDELTIAYMSGVHRGKELAAQRQWVGLTDKQMVDAIEPLYLNRSTAEMAAKVSMDEFRAIEAKLKEENT